MVRAAQYFSAGQLDCVIRVDSTRCGAISFGLCRPDTPLGDVVPGSPIVFLPYMWMPDHRMTFCENVPTRGDPYGRTIKTGDSVRMLVDLVSGIVSFSLCVCRLGGLVPARSRSARARRSCAHACSPGTARTSAPRSAVCTAQSPQQWH